MKLKCISFAICFSTLALSLLCSDGNNLSRIGTGEDASGLIYPRQVKEGPDGNIYVYDEYDASIKIYSPSGTFLRKMGGSGEGPGDIKRKDGVKFGFTADNKLFFTQYFGGHRWLTMMTLDGRLYGTTTFLIKTKMFGIEQAVVLPEGEFLIEFAFLGGFEKRKNYYLHSEPRTIYKVDSEGQIVSKIKESNYLTRISKFSRGADLALPFNPKFKWSPFKGNTILFTDGMDTKLNVLDYKGNVIREIDTSLPKPATVTSQDLDKWRSRIKQSFSKKASDIEWYNNFGNVIDKYKSSIYPMKPYIEELSVTPEGNILITGTVMDGSSKRTFWLLDSNGKMLKQIAIEAYYLSISNNFIFLKVKDKEDYTNVFFFKRKKSEEQDFVDLQELDF